MLFLIHREGAQLIDSTQQHAVSESSPILTRRHLLQAGMTGIAVSVLSPWSSWAAPSGVLVNDVTMLNPIWVNRLLAPRTTGEIQQALAMSSGPVSIGGGRYSMGGRLLPKTACTSTCVSLIR